MADCLIRMDLQRMASGNPNCLAIHRPDGRIEFVAEVTIKQCHDACVIGTLQQMAAPQVARAVAPLPAGGCGCGG